MADAMRWAARHGRQQARQQFQQRQQELRDERRSSWSPRGSQPPNAGIIAGSDGGHENLVSFKSGGPSGDETLIADGDYHDDNEGFTGPRGARHHNHYGPDFSEDRGKYTGPDH